MLRIDGWWRILEHSDTNKRVDLSRGEGWRCMPSSSSIIHQCAELQTAHRGGRAALHLTSACFCLHAHTRAVRRTHDTLLTPAAQTRPAHETAASSAPQGCQTGAGCHVQSRLCNQWRGGGAHRLLTEQEVLCLSILRGGIKLPRGADGQQQGEKNIMKFKKIPPGFLKLMNVRNPYKKTATHFITLDSSFRYSGWCFFFSFKLCHRLHQLNVYKTGSGSI